MISFTFFKMLFVFLATLAAVFGVTLVISTFRFELTLGDFGQGLALLLASW